jgi:hypothetical protein
MDNVLKITCPECGAEFELTKSLEKDIKQHLEEEIQKKYKKRFDELEQMKEDVDKEKKQIAKEIENGIKQEKEKLKKQIKEELVNEAVEENKLLKEDLKKIRKDLKEAKSTELEVEKLKDKLDKQGIELETKIRKELKKEKKEREEELKRKYEGQLKEKEIANKRQIESMKKTIEELKKKADQKSSKIQGEVQELILQNILEEMFPDDSFKEVKSGKTGSDIIQTVIYKGKKIGKIAIESKKTENWSNKWIKKLKKDIEDSKSDIGILVTQAMPKDIDTIGTIDNIWVADFNFVKPIAYTIRTSLIEIKRTQKAANIKDEHLEVLYQYIISNSFVSKIQNIVKSFQSMKTDLEKEKSSMEKIWAKREQEINNVIKNTARLYGDLQGQLDNKLPEVTALQMIEE